MSDFLINIELNNKSSYQHQIREKLIELIKKNAFGNNPLPSSRKLSQHLGVSRNTIVLVYDSLVDDGYLISRKRSGFFVNPDINIEPILANDDHLMHQNSALIAPEWSTRIKKHPSQFPSLNKDKNWINYKYPFIYGYINAQEFPIAQWRECSRIAESRNKLSEWVEGFINMDDPELVYHIRQFILPKRGIVAQEDEILITLGTQNSLFLISNLLGNKGITFGVENPGYGEFRHIVTLSQSTTIPLKIDEQGIQLGKQLTPCDYLFVTPSHQYPTTVTMSIERRKALLEQANQDNFVIIEDDYESEINFIEKPLPALKSYDKNGRVIYVGSLSKSLAPGIRVGYLVADKKLVNELRTLRHLHYRYPPSNNQRITALFISQGYYDSHVRHMRGIYKEKWQLMNEAIRQHFHHCEIHATAGGFCFWIGLPLKINSTQLRDLAAKKSVFIESGDSLFMPEKKRLTTQKRSYIRLGFTAIEMDNIIDGITILGQLIDEIALKKCN